MIGNSKLFEAVQALASAEKDARSRVVIALQIIEKMHPSELDRYPDLKRRLQAVSKDASKKGPATIQGKLHRDKYENTALHRKNSTYSKLAQELFSIWLETRD